MAYSHSTREACQALRISDRTLLRLRREGVLRAGDHFRVAGAGVSRPPLLWNIEEVERTLARRSRRVLHPQRPAARPCAAGASSGGDPATAAEQEPGFFH
jgi:hypothetical protein